MVNVNHCRRLWLPLVWPFLALGAGGELAAQVCKYDSIPATAPASRFTVRHLPLWRDAKANATTALTPTARAAWRWAAVLLTLCWAGGVWAVAAPIWPLNDTGIDWWADGSRNLLAAPPAGCPGQDASQGRDAFQDNDADGHAGFSFTKLDANGNALPAGASAWSCVRDNVTGLIWEVKTDDGGLRDRDWSYSWYNPDATRNGGWAGYQNKGSCGGGIRGIHCDTLGFTQAVNQAGLCGATDWRLPNRKELQSIVDRSRINPSIDTSYFPDVGSSRRWYWSSSSFASQTGHAWFVDFNFGDGWLNVENYGSQVRLVRGGQALPFAGAPCTSAIAPSQQTQGATGGSGTVAVAAPAACAWRVLSDAPWIQVSTGQSGTGNGNVTYNARANTLASGRLGTLTIGGRTFTVWQAGRAAVVGPADLGGTIRNVATGQPLGGAVVQLGAAQTFSAAGSGAYAFTGVSAGDYSLTVSKAGFGPVTQNLTLTPRTSTVRDLSLREAGNLGVTGVTSRYDKHYFFLEGADHQVDFTTQVDWAGQTPKLVRLMTDRQVHEVAAAPGAVTARLNAGTEFRACGGLKAQAVSQSGQSPPFRADFGVMSNPLSFVPFWSRTDKGNTFSYSPSIGVDWDFFGSESAKLWHIPDQVPLFGGKKFSLEYFPDLSVELGSDGTLEVRLDTALDDLY